MTTIPQKDTEQSLFYSAINALRIAGQEKIADDLDQRMENLLPDNEFTALVALNRAAEQVYNVEGDKWQQAYETLEGVINKLTHKELTQPIKTPKVAIYVKGGMVEAIRSNIGQTLEVEIIDADNEPDKAEDYWEEVQSELEFGNY